MTSSWIDDNDWSTRRENIKCVVVGDTGVGKTRLICARACNQRLIFDQLLAVHTPTVFAIDQYRINRNILERSYERVDESDITLRLWDTFGDHHTDRRFAYGRSDVVLLCFSIANARSLSNVRAKWLPEIRRACPHTPIVLVGCKNDLRHLIHVPEFRKMLADRKPLLRQITNADIVPPELGRQMAAEIDAPYYEASVYTFYGVNDVFRNAVRAALCRRRELRFWSSSSALPSVQRPVLQAPWLPPKQDPPVAVQVPSRLHEDALSPDSFPDVVLQFDDGRTLKAHRLVLAACSTLFWRLFVCDANPCFDCPAPPDVETPQSSAPSTPANQPRSARTLARHHCSIDTSTLPRLKMILSRDSPSSRYLCSTTSLHSTATSTDTHTTELLRNRSIPASMTGSALTAESDHTLCADASLHARSQWKELDSTPVSGIREVAVVKSQHHVRCSFSPRWMDALLQCIYSGTVVESNVEMVTLARQLEMTSLLKLIDTTACEAQDQRDTALSVFLRARGQSILELGFRHRLFTDISFQCDDRPCLSHKFLLTARCEVMRAMLGAMFKESSLKQISFPGVTCKLFSLFLRYAYTDAWDVSSDALTLLDYTDMLELANRLGLPHLLHLIQTELVAELDFLSQSDCTIAEDILLILEPAQLLRADHLSAWCLHYLATNYNRICRAYPKYMKQLSQANQEVLERTRWPAVWYLKEQDVFERMSRERARPESVTRLRLSTTEPYGGSAAPSDDSYSTAPTTTSGSGCLCLRSSRRQQHNSL